MTTRDMHSNILPVRMIDPIVGNNDTEGTPVTAQLDTRGFQSAEILIYFGISGDTLSGSVKVDVILQDSADGSTWAAVTDTNFALVGSNSRVTAPTGAGLVATIDAAAEDPDLLSIGYVGPQRYVRCLLDFTGTHTNGIPIAMIGLLINGSAPVTAGAAG